MLFTVYHHAFGERLCLFEEPFTQPNQGIHFTAGLLQTAAGPLQMLSESQRL